jgi:hypothetical protein
MNIEKLFILGIIVLSSICIVHANEGKESIAVQVAQEWLATVDSERYDESWEIAADYFKNAVTIAQWRQAMVSVRKPLGKVNSRQLKSKQLMTELPGAPDGEYVVIQYETSFEHKKSAIETITPMLDKDGKWRVSGYYIK